MIRHRLLLLCLFLSGCMSGGVKTTDSGETVTRAKRLLGIVPVPGTGGEPVATPSGHAEVISQLAPLIWIGAPLIAAGLFFWIWTKGSTGIGRALAAAGLVLVMIAVLAPHLVLYVKIAALIALLTGLVVGGYMAYKRLRRKEVVYG